jgi:biotin carboxyl carrier protein
MRYLATLQETEHEFEFEDLGANACTVRLGEERFELDLRRVGPGSFSVLIGERSFDFDVTPEGEELIVTSRVGTWHVNLIDEKRRAMRASAGRQLSGRVELKAMMPGRVVSVLVKPGDEIDAEHGVLIVEAMKMENEIRAPKAGRVIEVRVAAGQTVEKGEVLAVIE